MSDNTCYSAMMKHISKNLDDSVKMASATESGKEYLLRLIEHSRKQLKTVCDYKSDDKLFDRFQVILTGMLDTHYVPGPSFSEWKDLIRNTRDFLCALTTEVLCARYAASGVKLNLQNLQDHFGVPCEELMGEVRGIESLF
jgi:hypothetical protein